MDPPTINELRRFRDIVARTPLYEACLGKLGLEPLSAGEKEALRNAVADELAGSCYRGTPESDKIGTELDDLIDRLGHF